MRWGVALLAVMLIAQSASASFQVNWTRPGLTACYLSVNSQVESAYSDCMANCNSDSLFGFILSPITRGSCRSDCERNVLAQQVDTLAYSKCLETCHNSYAGLEFGYCHASYCRNNASRSQCTAACYGATPAAAMLKNCTSGCRERLGAGGKALSARDFGYLSCAKRLSMNITEKKGFLYLPFNSTKGLRVNTGWNYTNERDSCGNYTSSKAHNAIDFDRPDNSSIHSASSGVVIEAVSDCGACTSGLGAYVKVEASDGARKYVISYGHMINGSVNVSAGGYVSAGQYLGILGTTGNSDGTHLHFQVKDKNTGTYVDPYDIYSIDECEYPWGAYLSKPCGPDYLWAECPPVPYGQ